MTRARCSALAWALGAGLALACGPAAKRPGPPDLLLVVVDTLRADAVSSQGEIADTTPFLDGLADTGLRYSQARSVSAWTLPAHVSLFSGLLPPRHGVGSAGRMIAPDTLPSMLEALGRQGYQTAGFSENPVVGPAFGLARGFDHFEARSIASLSGDTPFGLEERLRRWLEARDASRPFFVFVNLMDAHEPYRLRSRNEFLAPGQTTEDARQSLERHPFGLCDDLPPPAHLEILRALYHGDVREADRRLEQIHALARGHGGSRMITVITSDHGEQFGERRLLDHQFSVAEALLRIPLVVHGVPGAVGVVDTPVSLLDVTASLLAWAGASMPGLPDHGRPLPLPGEERPQRSLFGFYSQWRGIEPESWPEDVPPLWSPGLRPGPSLRASCGARDRVFGDMAAVTRDGWKLIRFDRYPSELYQLGWDRDERSDVAAHHPALVAELEAEIESLEAASASGQAAPLDEAGREALRALGYLD